MSFFVIAVIFAVFATILGIAYLLTIGRLTDFIPLLGFGDDVLVFLFIVLSWLLVFALIFVSNILELLMNPLVWVVIVVVFLVLLVRFFLLSKKRR